MMTISYRFCKRSLTNDLADWITELAHARLQELARLLGGSEVTRNTLANAKELLAA